MNRRYFSNLLVERALSGYADRVVPLRQKLRSQIIHNDVNQNNTLCDDKVSRVTGLIDFGDMVDSRLVHDLAITIAHQLYRRDEPLEAACEIVRGYCKVIALEKAEFEALFDLVAMRLATREIVVSWKMNVSGNTGNYRTDISTMGWEALRKWQAIRYQHATQNFFDSVN